MDEAMQIIIKTGYTLLLGLVMLFCGVQMWKTWVRSKPVLAMFRYSVNGADNKDASRQFADLVVRDLSQIARLFSGESGGSILPSTDQLGRAHRAQLVDVESNVWGNIQLEAYGVKFSAIFDALGRMIDPPNEISGSVDEIDGKVTVFASLRGRMSGDDRKGARWYLTDMTARDEASFALATRLYFRATDESFIAWGDITDDAFYLFCCAARDYGLYRARLLLGREDDAKAALKEADRLVTLLVTRSEAFSLGHKLAGYIAREQGDAARAQDRFKRYLALAKDKGRWEDKDVIKAVEELEAARLAAAGAGAPTAEITPGQTHTVQPGMVVRAKGSSGAASSVCCIVKDLNGKQSAVVPAFLFDNRTSDTVLCEGMAFGGSGWVLGESAEFFDTKGEPAPFALVPLAARVTGTNKLQGVQGLAVIKGVTGEVRPGDDVVLIGFQGRTAAAKVLGTHTAKMMYEQQSLPQSGTLSAAPDSAVRIEPVSRPGDGGGPVVLKNGSLVGMLYSRDDSGVVRGRDRRVSDGERVGAGGINEELPRWTACGLELASRYKRACRVSCAV